MGLRVVIRRPQAYGTPEIAGSRPSVAMLVVAVVVVQSRWWQWSRTRDRPNKDEEVAVGPWAI